MFPVTWFALRALYDDMFALAGMGLIWFVLALAIPFGMFYLTTSFVPYPVVIALGMLVALIPIPPVTAALYYVAMQLALEKRIEFGYFWTAFKSYFGRSWQIGGLLLASGAVLVVDVVFYLSSDNVVFAAIGFLGIWALLFWLAVQIYLYPLMVYQEDVRLRLLLKNASLLTLAYPFFALGILIVTLLATALSALLLFIFLATVWMPFVAILNCRATVSSLGEVDQFRQRQIDLGQEQDGDGQEAS
jgi:uncharacterized membrane protein YesL